MKKIRGFILIFSLSFFMQIDAFQQHKAVICKPVADLIGEPFANHALKRYKHIPLFVEKNGKFDACSRIHQALFNETVTLIDETEAEYCIEIMNSYFITTKRAEPHTRYWTSKTNCALITEALKAYIPAPISYKEPTSITSPNTITLTQPWHDAATKSIFSVGTRLICDASAPHDGAMVPIILFDHATHTPLHRNVPRTHCITTSPENKRQAFITLMRSWIAGPQNTVVPYVWGGCSYAKRYHGAFKKITKKENTTISSYYIYPKTHVTPEVGFDCTGLIMRTAQLAGIPFFYKNSYTMASLLPLITDAKQLAVGDLIWIPGHVLIIADLERNTIIEARGYPHGYGKLQEMPISEAFRDISRIEQIIDNYHAHKALLRLNKEGTVVATIPSFKILRLY